MLMKDLDPLHTFKQLNGLVHSNHHSLVPNLFVNKTVKFFSSVEHSKDILNNVKKNSH